MTRLSLHAIHHRFVFFGLVLLLAACSAATPRTPDTYYDFSLALPPLAFGTTDSIALQRVDIRGVQSGRALVVVAGETPRRFQELRGHYWHVAAPTLIERAFIDAMRDASSDARFASADMAKDAPYRITLSVTEFAFHPGETASIRFDAVVTHKKQGTILSESYWGSAPVGAGASASAGVTALSEAASIAFGLMAKELAAAL